MTRIGKQQERRHRYPHKRKPCLNKKTGAKKDNLKLGFKEHANALSQEFSCLAFIPKIK